MIKAEVQVSNAQLEIIRAENAVLLAKAGLSAAMGLPVTTEFAVAAPEAHERATGPSLQEALAGAPAQRPELAAVKARQAAADAAVRQAQKRAVSDGQPRRLLRLAGERLSRRTRSGASASRSESRYSSGGSRARGSPRPRPAAAASGPPETQTLRAIELEVEQAWLLVQEAEERQEVTKKIREQAEEDDRVSEGRYQEGLGTMLEVIDARTVLTQAGANAVIARYDSAQARARLDRALGRDVAGGDEMKQKQWVVVGVVLAVITAGAVPAYRKYAAATARVPQYRTEIARRRDIASVGPGHRGDQGEGRGRGQGRRAHLRPGR